MNKYTITYYLQPDADNIKFDIMARDHDEAVAYAKDYRKESFTVEESTGSNLKEMRTRRGMTQAQLADASGVGLRMIQQYEQRQNDINKAAAVTVYQMAKALHCAVEDILEI